MFSAEGQHQSNAQAEILAITKKFVKYLMVQIQLLANFEPMPLKSGKLETGFAFLRSHPIVMHRNFDKYQSNTTGFGEKY